MLFFCTHLLTYFFFVYCGITKKKNAMVNFMSLEDCMRCVDFSGINYKEMVKHYDNNAMGDNFAVVAPDDSVVGIFLPNLQYDTYYLSFDDDRTGTTEIEEFKTFRSLLGYLKEQFENLV